MKLSIPIIPTILWLEINYYGKTILPELLTLTYLLTYFILKLFWRKNEKVFVNYFNYFN
jgi:hypothetical protein